MPGRNIRQASQDVKMPAPRRGLSRARDIGTEASTRSFAILFTVT
jgi:hypothetical protein